MIWLPASLTFLALGSVAPPLNLDGPASSSQEPYFPWKPAPPACGGHIPFCIHCTTVPRGKEVPLFEQNKYTSLRAKASSSAQRGWLGRAHNRIHSSPECKASEPFTALSRFVHSACTGQESYTSCRSPPGPRWVSPRSQAQVLGVYTRPPAAAYGSERCWTSMMGLKAQLLPTLTRLGLLKPLSQNNSLGKPCEVGRAPLGLGESR